MSDQGPQLPQESRLSAEQCRALALLASFPHGIIEDVLVLGHGLDRALIVGLVDAGLAAAEREILAASDGALVELVRIRITDAGRRALEA
jgi:hypothetical protein